MVSPDLFSDSLHDMVRDPALVHNLGTVEGVYADLVGQDLPDNLPIIKSCLNALLSTVGKFRPGDLVPPVLASRA